MYEARGGKQKSFPPRALGGVRGIRDGKVAGGHQNEKSAPYGALFYLAETAGFEPACRLPDNLISSQARYGLFDTSPYDGVCVSSADLTQTLLCTIYTKKSSSLHRDFDVF